MLRSPAGRGEAQQALDSVPVRLAGRRVALGAALTVVVALGATGCTDREREERTSYLVTVDLQADVGALAAIDEDDGDERAQAAAQRLRALGVHARPALLAALDREPTAVRVTVAGLLGELPAGGADEVVPARLARLARDDAAAEVRAAAIVALADAGTARAGAVVESALHDRDAAVRLAAAGVCPGLCTSDAALDALARMAALEANAGHALAARRVLTEIRAHGTTTAAVAVATRRAAQATLEPDSAASPAQQVQAALLLADLGDARGERALLAAASRPPVPALRVHAVYALGLVGGPASVEVLSGLLREPGVAPYAVDAMTRLAARGVGEARASLDAYDGPRRPFPLPPP